MEARKRMKQGMSGGIDGDRSDGDGATRGERGTVMVRRRDVVEGMGRAGNGRREASIRA